MGRSNYLRRFLMTNENELNEEVEGKAEKPEAPPQKTEAELRDEAIREVVDEKVAQADYHRQADAIWEQAKKAGLDKDTQGEIYDALRSGNLQNAALTLKMGAKKITDDAEWRAAIKAYGEGQISTEEFNEIRKKKGRDW
jgi:hypothetical protein